MSHELPSFLEDDISQIPALQLLQNLGWEYLTPQETVTLRAGKLSSVMLEGVLVPQLRKFNKIRFKGGEYEFSEANIQSAIQALREVVFDGLIRTNEKIYDLLILGKSLSQTIDGDTKSFPLFYIDWNLATFLTNNVFHVTEEFEVERSGSHETRRPDLVLFVNGIPLAVIECKRPDLKEPIEQAISQHLRNQRDDEIPQLFLFSQLLLGVSKNEAKYGTTGTALKFWSVWKEDVDAELAPLVNRPLTTVQKDRMFGDRNAPVRAYFEQLEQQPREVTPQDRTLYSLCRPERLLDLMFNFTLFDAGDKKVARYQQFFCIKKILQRIRQYGAMHTRMRKALPNACFIGFTGTPVTRKEKNTINKFGGLIDTYTIRQAVDDKAVVPLLYEGRDVEQQVDRKTIDRWFDQLTVNLTPELPATRCCYPSDGDFLMD